MGKHSNIILLNNNDFIIDSLRHLDSSENSSRDILPARKYILPASNKSSFLEINNFNDFNKIIENDPSKIYSSFTGISKLFVDFCLKQCKNNLADVFAKMKTIVSQISSTNISCIKLAEKNYVISLTPKQTPLDINFFIDDYYYQKETKEKFNQTKNNLLNLANAVLKKYKNRINSIENKLNDCEKMDTYRIYGELIISNLYKISDVHTDSVSLENYYENNQIITIPLDKKLSPSNNAKAYFKKYTKLKNALEIVSKQKEETLSEIYYLESIIYEIENCTDFGGLHDISLELAGNENFKKKFASTTKKKNMKNKKQEELSAPLEFDIDGFKVLVGKNNKQNDYLTLKIAKPYDIWFHTKDFHGSHVILRANGKDSIMPSSETLYKCAKLAAFHSKAKNSSNVPVDYTYVKNVKKPSNSKPGMVIYVNYNTLYVN